MGKRILVVDDDPQIISLLERYLEKHGFEFVCASSGKQMRDILSSQDVDLCVLDIGLPDTDGFTLTREIRQNSNMPVIVLSARDETYDMVLGLEIGADDYITKPFEPRELIARIKTVLRRLPQDIERPNEASAKPLLRFGDWIMDRQARTLMHGDNREYASLTSMEFDILRAFLEHPNAVLSRDQLLDLAHGPSIFVGDRAIDVHIMRLRKKIEPDPTHPRYIKTVHGVGYCLTETVSGA